MLLAKDNRPIDFDVSTVRLFQPSHQVYQSGLSAAIISKKPQHLILLHLECDI